jgi:hypothetical protein
MYESIRPITDEEIAARGVEAARHALEAGVILPHDFTPGTHAWRVFDRAYQDEFKRLRAAEKHLQEQEA